MHYKVQLDVWRTVFGLASRLDIQVFATSHSWDSIEAFQKAAAETPEKGVWFGCLARAKTYSDLF